MKKGFSLIELMVSIVLISLMFGVYISKGNKTPSMGDKEIELKTLKTDLIEAFSFEKSLRLVCLEKDMNCFVLVDGSLKKENPIKNLFEELPIIYNYSEDLIEKSFSQVEFEKNEVEEVFFDFFIDKDYKTKDMIMFYQNKYYIYNAINIDAIIVNNQYEISSIFQNKIEKIKDAF